jgi:hypothetical protein
MNAHIPAAAGPTSPSSAANRRTPKYAEIHIDDRLRRFATPRISVSTTVLTPSTRGDARSGSRAYLFDLGGKNLFTTAGSKRLSRAMIAAPLASMLGFALPSCRDAERPPCSISEQVGERWDQQRAHDERVDQYAQRDRSADLHERFERQ